MELRKRDESPTKEFVDVICAHWQKDGSIQPLRIHRQNGEIIPIARVLDVRRAASLKAGGQGMRYQCRVVNDETERSMELYLFHDGSFWFIENNNDGGIAACAEDTTRT